MGGGGATGAENASEGDSIASDSSVKSGMGAMGSGGSS